jgi:membrane protein DedA with SNARE-associated domain
LEIYELIAEYGRWFYAVTVVWTFLEGETFVIFAGAAAFHGFISLPPLIAAAWFGSFAGDQFYFFIGRRYGQRLLIRFPRWRGGVDLALGFLHKYHIGFILTFRFVYGVRNFSSFAMGMSDLSWPRFLALNFLAAGAWACTFAGAGYFLGQAFEAVLGEIARDFGLVMLAVFLVIVWTILALYRRRVREIERAAILKNGPAVKKAGGETASVKRSWPA